MENYQLHGKDNAYLCPIIWDIETRPTEIAQLCSKRGILVTPTPVLKNASTKREGE